MLQRVLLVVSLLAMCPGTTIAGGARSPEELAQKVGQAIEAKDAAAVSSLYNWEGLRPDIKGPAQALSTA